MFLGLSESTIRCESKVGLSQKAESTAQYFVASYRYGSGINNDSSRGLIAVRVTHSESISCKT